MTRPLVTFTYQRHLVELEAQVRSLMSRRCVGRTTVTLAATFRRHQCSETGLDLGPGEDLGASTRPFLTSDIVISRLQEDPSMYVVTPRRRATARVATAVAATAGLLVPLAESGHAAPVPTVPAAHAPSGIKTVSS